MPYRPSFLPRESLRRADDLAFSEQVEAGISNLKLPAMIEDGIAALRTTAFGSPTATEWTPTPFQPPVQPLPIQVSPPLEMPRFDPQQMARQQQLEQEAAASELPATPQRTAMTPVRASGGPAAAMPGGGGAPAQPGEIEAYIRQGALARGKDPDEAVRVALSEGGLDDPTRQSDVIAPNGQRERSYGPYQMYMDGGLGNAALARGIDPRNPAQWRETIDFALDHAAANGWGAWNGAKRIGLTEWGAAKPGQTAPPARPTGPQPTTPVPAEDVPAAQAQAGRPTQFADGLSWEEAIAACGLAGVAWFTQKTGRTPSTVAEVKQAAQISKKWDAQTGMYGAEATASLLRDTYGIPAVVENGVDWAKVRRDVQAGNPVMFDTTGGSAGHYYTVSGVRQRADGQWEYDLDTSATDLRSSRGRRWYTVDEVVNLGFGAPHKTIYINNPQTPTPSVAVAEMPKLSLNADGAPSPARSATPAGAAAPSSAAPASGYPPAPWLNEESGAGDDLLLKPGDDWMAPEEPAPDPNAWAAGLAQELGVPAPEPIAETPTSPPRIENTAPDYNLGPGDGGTAPTPAESGINRQNPTLQTTVQPTLPGDGGYAPTPAGVRPYDPDEGPREAPAGTVGAQPLPQTPNPMSYGPIEQAPADLGPEMPEDTIESRLGEAARGVYNAPLVQAAVTAAQEAYNDPVWRAFPAPARATYLVSQAFSAFGEAAAREVAKSLGVSDEELFSILGHPVSGQDVAGFAGSLAADPTNYVGLGLADPLMTVARGAFKDVAPEIVQRGARAAGGMVREGAEALGRGLQGVGREVAGGLMDLNPSMTPRMAGDAGPGIGRALADAGDAAPAPGSRLASALPFDPSSAALGGAAGAASEGEDGEAGDPLRTAMGVALGVMGRRMAPKARRALAEAMQQAESLKAAGKVDEAAAVVNRALSDAGYDPRLSPEPVLPGMEPPRRVTGDAGPSVSDAPNRPPALGDVPPSAIRQDVLPGLEEPKPRPIEEVVGEFRIPESLNTPQVQRALSAAERRAENMQRRGLTTPSAWDWIKQAGYAGIYGPATLTNAVIGGAQELVMGQPKELARALVSGRPGSYGAQFTAQLRAIPDGLAGLGRVLFGAGGAEATAARSGGSQGTANLSERVVNPVGHFMARMLERPGEILTEAPDAVFRPLFTAQGMQREARAIAAETGRKGADAASYADELVRAAEDLRANPDAALASGEARRIVDAGAKYADELGYKGDPGGFGRWLAQSARRDDAIGVLASFLVPFPSMAARMSRAAARSTPGIGLLPQVRRGQPSAFDVVYDQTFGTAVAGGLALWAFNGGITGSGPADAEKRQMMIDQGWQPNSVLVAGHYIPNRVFGRFQPMLDTAGEIHDSLAYGKPDAKPGALAADLVKRGTRIATNQTGLSGLADLHDMLTQGFASRFPGWLARSGIRYVPYGGVLRAGAASIDDSPRKPESWGDVGLGEAVRQQASMAAPGLRQELPATQDTLGRPVPNPQQGFGAVIPRVTTQRDDPVIRLFQDAGVDIGKPSDSISVGSRGIPVSLKPAEQRRWNALRGQLIEQYADAYTGNAEFMALPPQQKERYLKTFLQKAATYADKMLQAEMDLDDLTQRATAGALKKASGQ